MIRTDGTDGGPTFPAQEDERMFGSYGMSLRDWFAGQVLAGIVANPEGGTGGVEIVSLWAYRYADAMLKARDE